MIVCKRLDYIFICHLIRYFSLTLSDTNRGNMYRIKFDKVVRYKLALLNDWNVGVLYASKFVSSRLAITFFT